MGNHFGSRFNRDPVLASIATSLAIDQNSPGSSQSGTNKDPGGHALVRYFTHGLCGSNNGYFLPCPIAISHEMVDGSIRADQLPCSRPERCTIPLAS